MQERVDHVAVKDASWVRRLRGDLTGALSAVTIALPMSVGYSITAFAVLDNQPRSADVIADTDVKVYRLAYAEFECLRKTHPDVINKLVLNMSLNRTHRLWLNTEEIRRLEES